MSDGTSAEIFSTIFEYIDKHRPGDIEFIKYLCEAALEYDFSMADLYMDEFFIKHDLIRSQWDSDWGCWEAVYFGEYSFDGADSYHDSDDPGPEENDDEDA